LSRVVYTDAHITLAMDEAHGLVQYTRSALPFSSVDAMSAAHEKMTAAFPAFLPKGLKLLVDVREAPPRNDDAFEAVVMKLMGAFTKRFAAHAFLVKSAVGRLQTNRLARVRGSAAPAIFDDEREALRFLGIAD
jgi:hypothetical protein